MGEPGEISPEKDAWWVLLAIILALPFGAGWYYFYGPVSAADAKKYGPPCAEWISKEFNSGRNSAVFDSWKKHGKLVFEVATANTGSNRVSLQLCVVDKSKNTMEKPSVLDRSWK